MPKRVSLLVLFGVLSFVSPCYALSIVAGPYLQNPSQSSMTVLWITDQKCTSWVEYGADDSLDQRALHSEHGLIDADQTIHRVTIKGLSAGQEYTYRVCSKEILKFEPYKVTYGETITGDTYAFTTLSRDQERISFIVLNDIHQRDDLLASLIKMSACKSYSLVFLNGDILGHIEGEPQIIHHVLKPCSDLFAKEIPFIYVRGNHEARGKFARMLPNYLSTPKNRYYYSFDHGSVHFIVMDGGEDKEDSHWAYSGLAAFDQYREKQRIWLDREIQTQACKEATYRVVLVHMPPMPSEKWHGPNDLYDKWRRLLNKGKIDLMISAHLHSHRIVEPEKGVRNYPMVIGGGPKDGEATVIRVDATNDRLTLTMTRDDGEMVGKYLVKSKTSLSQNDGRRSLFNGKDLTGWEVKCLPQDRGKVFWKVNDGAIECDSIGKPEHNYVWLMTQEEFVDFHFRMKFQVFQSSTGNSGLQFRSRYEESDSVPHRGWLNGPQIDIHPPMPLRTGLIYDETLGVRRWIHPSLANSTMVPAKAPPAAHHTKLRYADDAPDAWNTLELICDGMKIRTVINGNVVSDYDATGVLDDETHRTCNVGMKGKFALQLHSRDELLIRFKEIEILDKD